MNPESRLQMGNLWYDWSGRGCQAKNQLTPDAFSAHHPYDVAILGAGVIGCALAYELSRYRLRIVVVDRGFDVGEGTSKANSAIIHTGFDATPGSLESQLVTEASREWPGLASKLKIPFQEVSALMVALNGDQEAQLPELREKAIANGVDDVELISSKQVRDLEPHVTSTACGGLVIPRESIVDPFTTSIAYAEVALENGADIALGVEIVDVDEPGEPVKWLVGARGIRIPACYIVNACGLGSRRLVERYGGAPMDINPRRGQFVVYDRTSSHFVRRILLPIPSKQTKGMLIAPTIFGNLLSGPTAEDLPADQVTATNTTAEGILAVLASGAQMCPALRDQPVIATYAGLRCNCAQGSYWMRFNDGHAGIVTLAGIRSTGLTASYSTARYVVRRLIEECGLVVPTGSLRVGMRPETRWPGWWRRPFADAAQVAGRPDYGRIVCSCENISRGEIQDALDSWPGVATLDGLKRRTRVLTGRCQGFNCCVPIAEMISRHFGVPLSAVTKRGPGSEFIARGENARALRPWPPHAQGTPRSQYDVVIIGAGPAGIGAAVGLAKRGVRSVLLIDRASEIGGMPAHYAAKRGGVPTFLDWSHGRIVFGQQYVELLRHALAQTSSQVWLECQVTGVEQSSRTVRVISPFAGAGEIRADAIVFACGARESTVSERGWIFGNRPARQFFTKQLLQLIDGSEALPAEHPAIIGSDVVAYSAAAKLQVAGAVAALMCDRTRRPRATLVERLYFARWSRPAWRPIGSELSIPDAARVHGIQINAKLEECDGVVFSGELMPNSELLVESGFDVSPASRVPVCNSHHELSLPGCFIAGAAIGGFRGAHWCYNDGRRAAKDIVRYLRRRK